MGGLVLLIFYAFILIYGFWVSFKCRHRFGRLLGVGLTTLFFLYVFVNCSMVMGLLPVVGVPLPLISYGGTALLTLLMGLGLLISIDIHQDSTLYDVH